VPSASSSTEVRKEVTDAFHQMWDAFPHLVLLLKRDRTIVASNRVAQERGAVAGLKCYEWAGAKSIHPGCKGNLAMDRLKGQRSVGNYGGRVLDSYWLPVGGEKDLLLHFSVDITPYAKEELLKAPS